MRIGLFPFCSDYSIPAYELAIAAEKRRGYSIWLSEHTHIPASRDTPSSGTPSSGDGDLPGAMVSHFGGRCNALYYSVCCALHRQLTSSPV
jgi:hypothetical protein